MTHDEAFAALRERKRTAEADRPVIRWRPNRGKAGGWTGLAPAPEGAVVSIGDYRAATPDWGRGSAFAEVIDYGKIVDGERIRLGSAHDRSTAKRLAEKLSGPSPVLSDAQRAILDYLCAAGLAPAAPIRAETGVNGSTLSTLSALGLVAERAAGGREALYGLTDLGRAAIFCAINPDEQEAPMTAIETETLTEVKPDPKPETAKKTTKPADRRAQAAATAAKKTAEQPDGGVEDVTNRPNDALVKGAPTAADTKLFEEALAEVVALVPGSKTEDKGKYVRVLTPAGKVVACVDRPTSRGPGVVALRLRIGSKRDVAAAVKAAEARAKSLTPAS